MADLEVRLVRVHPAQYACDLFGRMAAPQQALDMAPQRAILRQACGASRRSRPRIGALLRERGAIAALASLARRLGCSNRCAPAHD